MACPAISAARARARARVRVRARVRARIGVRVRVIEKKMRREAGTRGVLAFSSGEMSMLSFFLFVGLNP
jgi:hypothetical protein